jgi:hypothetical protein
MSHSFHTVALSHGHAATLFSHCRTVSLPHYFHLFEILLFEIALWRLHLWRSTEELRSARCLVALPCTRLRHMRKLEAFISFRIIAITSASLTPNCICIASNGVLSSHAISIILSISCSVIPSKQDSKKIV